MIKNIKIQMYILCALDGNYSALGAPISKITYILHILAMHNGGSKI